MKDGNWTDISTMEGYTVLYIERKSIGWKDNRTKGRKMEGYRWHVTRLNVRGRKVIGFKVIHRLICNRMEGFRMKK